LLKAKRTSEVAENFTRRDLLPSPKNDRTDYRNFRIGRDRETRGQAQYRD
jgi:hypothetical protein